MSKTFRGENRDRNKKNWVRFQDKRNKRTIVEEKREGNKKVTKEY
jgi:hypothetical protein